MKSKNYIFELIDLFCGAGGLTQGAIEAHINGKPIVNVIACVNHDPLAIKSHSANHPDCIHFKEDIRTLDVNKLPQKNSNSFLVLHASLECTNFSNAKGGKPRDADSRTLANDLIRYIDHLEPDYITIENVREFMAWGPLNEKGKPESKDKGRDYLQWIGSIKKRGYNYSWKLMNSADFGAYTSRVRYFGIFYKKGLPVAWPQPTHTKQPTSGSPLKKWKAVKEVLDFNEKGESIFHRSKPLCDNTLKRIYAGLVKFISNGEESFIKKYYSGRPEGKVISNNGPAGTITTIDSQALVQPTFMVQYYGNSSYQSVEKCCPTLTTKDRLALINVKSIISKSYTSGQQNQSIEEPSGSITTVPKLNIVHFEGWLLDNQYNNKGKSLEDPAPTILASRRQQYIMNPQWGGNCKDLETPCLTLIARMDKSPLYLVSTEDKAQNLKNTDQDSEICKNIKLFMAHFGISDIKMRMLSIPELKRIQGFPETYKLEGSKTQQKKFIGNSVVPIIPKVWYTALGNALLNNSLNN